MKNQSLNVTARVNEIYNDGGKGKAIVSLLIEGVFLVRGVRLVEGKNGLFVSMPSRKTAEGEYADICFPIDNDVRLRILDTVIAAYEKALSEQDDEDADSEDGDDDESGAEDGE